MTTLEVLREARAHLTNPVNWVKHSYEVGEANCARGACHRASRMLGSQPGFGSLFTSEGIDACRVLDQLCDANGVMYFNDLRSTTHADILALFDRAIAVEEAKQNTTDVAATAHESEKEKVPQAVPRRRENAGCERTGVFV